MTKLPIDASGPIWSPQGDKIAFTAEVYPGLTPDQTAAKDKEKEASKKKVRIYDRLMIRHWNVWDEGKRSHLFVADAHSGEARDLTPKLEVNTPPAPFGGSSDYAWSPDGKELAFTAEPATGRGLVDQHRHLDGSRRRRRRRKTLPRPTRAPTRSPPIHPTAAGSAYVSQARAGFESDQWVLTLARSPDRPAHLADQSPRSARAVFRLGAHRCRARSSPPSITKEPWRSLASSSTKTELRRSIRTIDAIRLTRGGAAPAFSVSPKGGAWYSSAAERRSRPSWNASSMARYPGQLDCDQPTRLTNHNAQLVADLDLQPAESFEFSGADGDRVQGWLVRPPGFDPAKKYPVVFLIHGGPQGAWHDEWHNRWNYGMFAAPGYAVVAINPRGSTGFGQKFTDQISQDWTGRVYDDLMKGLDHALKTYAFLDGTKVAACGGSYGGFMVNWIAGHSDRFAALISHAGVFDLTSKYGTTEELWFPEWEFGGPPWEKPEHYRERSPSSFVANFKTPTLVIHGALDFRVPDAQGLGMFTSLQRRGVPSRYVWFPDEGHWIAQAQNRTVWWHEVTSWLDRYLKH